MSDLPKGWCACALADVGEIVTGNTPPKDNPANYGDKYPWVKPPDLGSDIPIMKTAEYLSEAGAEIARLLPAGTTLVSCIGLLGKVGYAGVTLATNQQINSVIFNPKLVEPRYGFHYCKTLRPWMENNSSSTTVAIINKGRFSEAPIYLAPLPEQRRIVAKLEKLLHKVDASKERLDKIPAILKRFRQSVLAAACSGRLTADWREKHASKTWQEVTLGDIIEDKPKNGYSAKPVKYETPYRVLTLTATTSGRFDDRHFKYFDEPIAEDSSLWLQPDDILVQRGNTIEYVGVSAIYDGLPNQFVFPDLMMRFRANQRVLTKFLYFALSWERTRNYLRERATGTAGSMPKINQPTLIGTPIDLPPIPEQYEIVRRVEALFKKADDIETRYKKAKGFVDGLTQSILAKAFRGELVSQDPNDEPAEKLLERIREERITIDGTIERKKTFKRKIIAHAT